MDTVLTQRNGHTHAEANADWRAAAISAAIQCSANDGSPLYVLLHAIQQHLPGYAAQVFWENRNRTLEALQRRLPDLRPMVAPARREGEEGIVFPILGWWCGTDAATGASYELGLAPEYYGDGSFVLAGPDADALSELLQEVLDDSLSHTCRCLRYTSGEWKDAPEMQAEIDRISWDDIVLAPDQVEDIRQTIDNFFRQKEVFASFGFPWRRGVLLVGPPGTGKTMVCKATAATHPEVPFLYVRDLNAARDAIEAIFRRARQLAPCILALEDIDGMIDRSNRTVFLNELDGFRNNDGVLIIASSNHPGKIDEALLKRPSRFDRVYHIGLPAQTERAEYGRRVLERLPNLSPDLDREETALRVASVTEGLTPAFLKEAYLSGALQMVQEGKATLDNDYADAVVAQAERLRKYLKKAKDPEIMGELAALDSDSIGFRPR